MKTKTPIWTYIITFLNPIIPSLIVIFLGGCFIVWKIGPDHQVVIPESPFIEVFYPALLLGMYLCMMVSLLHFYVIRSGRLRPRWWVNLLLILFAYGIVPLLAVLMEPLPPNASAQSTVAIHFGIVFWTSFIGFVMISLTTKRPASSIEDGVSADPASQNERTGYENENPCKRRPAAHNGRGHIVRGKLPQGEGELR